MSQFIHCFSWEEAALEVLEVLMWREGIGKIQARFREDSGKINGRFREGSGKAQGRYGRFRKD